jgi:hypothetical protein
MLQKILQRAKQVNAKAPSPFLDIFLRQDTGAAQRINDWLFEFCQLDDYDMMGAVKAWQMHEDKILSRLSRSLVERNLLKVRLQATAFEPSFIKEKTKEAVDKLGITEDEAAYFVFTGEASNTTYDPGDEKINILFKDGSVKDISQVDNALIQHNLKGTVKKYYICYYRAN